MTTAYLMHHPAWDAVWDNPRFDSIVERRRAFEADAAREAEEDKPWLP